MRSAQRHDLAKGVRFRALESSLARALRPLRLRSIRSRLVAFSFAATLIPTVTTAWISYVQHRRSLSVKVAQELRGASTQGARELDLWLEDRQREMRAFAESDEMAAVVEEAAARAGTVRPAGRERLSRYLGSMLAGLSDFEELRVVGAGGSTLASSGSGTAATLGRVTWWTAPFDDGAAILRERDPALMLTAPIVGTDGRPLGALAGTIPLRTLLGVLRDAAALAGGEVYAVDAGGLPITAGQLEPAPRAVEAAVSALPVHQPGTTLEYRNDSGVQVVGFQSDLARFGWTVVAEMPRATAFADVLRLRNRTVLAGAAIVIVVGLLASALGILIVGPLNRLRDAAARVAHGDLDVRVPASVNGEIGYLTDVFNLMVERLKEGRRELEHLSVTDALTGLHNRRRLMDVLYHEARRAGRNEHEFSVLMIDVDHFKPFNDTLGHVEGDEALRRVAVVLKQTMRTVDHVARYGGDEFLVLMPETPLDMAVAAAERLRARLAEECFGPDGRRVTLSIGAAQFSPPQRRPDEVVAAADRALYRAKELGRDRCVGADELEAMIDGQERLARPRTVPPRFALAEDRAQEGQRQAQPGFW